MSTTFTEHHRPYRWRLDLSDCLAEVLHHTSRERPDLLERLDDRVVSHGFVEGRGGNVVAGDDSQRHQPSQYPRCVRLADAGDSSDAR